MHPFIENFRKSVIPALQKEFGYKNVWQAPRVMKVTINVGAGRALKDAEFVGSAETTLTRISGQKPVRTKAKKSIAAFKIRQGSVIGLKVTLRRAKMYDFLEKLINVTLPRVRDFHGLSVKAVDATGNMSIGFKEHIAFPEIRSDEIESIHGLEVTISTNAKNKQEGLALFKQLGFPFSH